LDQTLAINCRGLRKRFDEVVAVDGVDLDIDRGECFALLGPNGAGKTTTIEILEGLTTPDGGEVLVLGTRWTGGGDHALRERLGIQLQDTQLADKLTVEEVTRLFRSLYSRGRDPDEVLRLLELDAKRRARVHKLSGGQRQRLALACALISDPDVLFLDEPTTGLDPQARLQVWEVVEAFRSAGGTVLLTTHYMEEAAQLCDRVAIMDHGRIIALDTPGALVDALGADQVIEVEVEERPGEEALDEETLRTLPTLVSLKRHRGRYTLHVEDVRAALPATLAALEQVGVPLKNLSTHRATLDDVFVHLTGRALRDG